MTWLTETDRDSRPAGDRLAALWAEPGIVGLPGAHDPLAALLARRAGFRALYVSGAGVSASLALPDLGVLALDELAHATRAIVRASGLPVLVDGDTGYGEVLNVMRLVRELEDAGAAAVQLEDQVMPKKCGHMSGKAVIGVDEMVGKIRAAVAARRDPDLLLIARTDAAAVDGLAAAITRGRAYADAGADLLFVEAPTSEDDIATVAAELHGVAPLVFNWAEGGRTPPLSLDRIAELGFSLVLFPIGTLLAATAGIRALLATLRADGTPSAALPGLPTFDGFTDLIGLPEIRDLERRFGTP
jgi:2,3-dimethylmalate lyase